LLPSPVWPCASRADLCDKLFLYTAHALLETQGWCYWDTRGRINRMISARVAALFLPHCCSYLLLQSSWTTLILRMRCFSSYVQPPIFAGLYTYATKWILVNCGDNPCKLWNGNSGWKNIHNRPRDSSKCSKMKRALRTNSNHIPRRRGIWEI